MNNRIGNSNNLGKHEPYGNRELKYYKDIYGNDVRLMTSKERNIVNKSLIILIKVVLPVPFLPRSPIIFPLGIVRLIFFNTLIFP